MPTPTPSELRIDFPPPAHGTLDTETEAEIRQAITAWHAARVPSGALPDPLHVFVTPLTASEVWVDPEQGVGAWFQAGNVIDVFIDTCAPLGPGAAARAHLGAHLDLASSRYPPELRPAPRPDGAPAVAPPTVATRNDGSLRLVFCERPDAVLTDDETNAIIEVAAASHRLAREALASLQHPVTIAVTPTAGHQPNQFEATGLGAWVPSADHLHLFLNRGVAGGLGPSVHANLGAMLAHELHHCARYVALGMQSERLASFIFEGLATAHERDVSGVMPAHGDYSDIPAQAWLAEALADTELDVREWLFMTPDGRKWVGYRVGTYIADQASARSGLTAAQLVDRPAAEVVALAGIELARTARSDRADLAADR